MARTSKYSFYVREFLNQPGHHSGARVLLTVKPAKINDNQYFESPEVQCEIADCHEQIHLAFGLWEDEETENSIHKAKMLSDVFGKLAKALEKEAKAAKALKATMPPPENEAEPTLIRRRRRRGQ